LRAVEGKQVAGRLPGAKAGSGARAPLFAMHLRQDGAFPLRSVDGLNEAGLFSDLLQKAKSQAKLLPPRVTSVTGAERFLVNGQDAMGYQ